jgi:hypothetical protein
MSSNRSRANRGRKRKTPATRVRRDRPGVRASWRQSAVSWGSGRVEGCSSRLPLGRPQAGVVKKGEADRLGTGRETGTRGFGACHSDNRIAAPPRSRGDGRGRRPAGPRSVGAASRRDGRRSRGSRYHPWRDLRDCHEVVSRSCLPRWRYFRAGWQDVSKSRSPKTAFSPGRTRPRAPMDRPWASGNSRAGIPQIKEETSDIAPQVPRKKAGEIEGRSGNCHRFFVRGFRRLRGSAPNVLIELRIG